MKDLSTTKDVTSEQDFDLRRVPDRLFMAQESLWQLWCENNTTSGFTNVFLLAIQIRRKIRLAVIPFLAIRPQQIFAHATIAQLSGHVQNFVTITALQSRWEWNEVFIEFELRRKKRL